MISKYNAHFEDAGIRFECPICFQWKSQEKEMLILYCCSQKICIDCDKLLVQKLLEDIVHSRPMVILPFVEISKLAFFYVYG